MVETIQLNEIAITLTRKGVKHVHRSMHSRRRDHKYYAAADFRRKDVTLLPVRPPDSESRA